MLDDALKSAFRELARTTPGIDVDVYRIAGRDALDPILGHGDPRARVGFFGRDPGRDEVRHDEPFIGAGGQFVRRALYRQLHGVPLPDFEASRVVGRDFFWANTVPYKPIGNKAWSTTVKRRFHPLMRRYLLEAWAGRDIVTLGREAFLWFGMEQPKDVRDRLDALWAHQDRFTSSVEVPLEAPGHAGRVFRLHPLPHPSPLNATWYKRFPALLEARLRALDVREGALRV